MTFKRQSAFTFIELLIVVTIIGLLSAVLVVDFRSARETQSVSNLRDLSLALLQQSQIEVRSGSVNALDYDESEEGGDDGILQEWLCKGAYFNVGATPLSVEGVYDLADENCYSPEYESYGISSNGASILNIEVAGVEYESLLVFFEPPNGDVSLWGGMDEEDFSELSGHALIRIGHDNNEDLYNDIEVNYLSSSIHILDQNNDEE